MEGEIVMKILIVMIVGALIIPACRQSSQTQNLPSQQLENISESKPVLIKDTSNMVCDSIGIKQPQSAIKTESGEIIDNDPYDTSFIANIYQSSIKYKIGLKIMTAGKKSDPITLYIVQICDSTKGVPLQTIQDTSDQTTAANYELIDANLDDYLDFRFINWVDMAGNFAYHYWLYNVKTKKFEFSKKFSDKLAGDVFWRPETKTVISEGSIGCVGRCMEKSIYKITDNDLILIEQFIDEQEYVNGEEIIVTKHYKLIDGKMHLFK
jgi:hypothetical protein